MASSQLKLVGDHLLIQQRIDKKRIRDVERLARAITITRKIPCITAK